MKDEIKAGIIVITALVILCGLIIVIGGSKLFEKNDIYYVKFMNVAGLETGAQVKLGGVRMGRVLSIRPPEGPGKPIEIMIGLQRGTVLYGGTKAIISQVGFVGDVYLLLSVQNTSSDIIKVGGVIPSEEKVQFDTMLVRFNEVSQSIDTLITDINKMFSPENVEHFENLVGNTNKAIVSGSENLDTVTAGLQSTTQKLETVLNEIESLVRENRGEIVQLIQKAREDIDKTETAIERIASAAQAFEKTAHTADDAIEVHSHTLENLLQNMSETTLDLQDLIQELKNKPWSILYREKPVE